MTASLSNFLYKKDFYRKIMDWCQNNRSQPNTHLFYHFPIQQYKVAVTATPAHAHPVHPLSLSLSLDSTLAKLISSQNESASLDIALQKSSSSSSVAVHRHCLHSTPQHSLSLSLSLSPFQQNLTLDTFVDSVRRATQPPPSPPQQKGPAPHRPCRAAAATARARVKRRPWRPTAGARVMPRHQSQTEHNTFFLSAAPWQTGAAQISDAFSDSERIRCRGVVQPPSQTSSASPPPPPPCKWG